MTKKKFMRMAIELAKKGGKAVHPNPLVGAVIVKDGKVIGQGYHERFGGLHAERNAINDAKESCNGADIYVTLEPCCHQGKTPPCTNAIIENGFRRVIIGSRDPNPMVFGKGVKALESAGIEVIQDFLLSECDELNPVFFHYIKTGLPYVTLKYAMTMDGKIATKTGASKWITGEKARQKVHQMRHEAMAIMTGVQTVIEDDPMLNARIEGGIDPLRVICDSKLRIPCDSNIVKTAGTIDTIVSCAFMKEDDMPKDKKRALTKAGVSLINMPGKDGRVDMVQLLKHLAKRGIDSILVESGGLLSESLLREGLVNEICVFIAPKVFGGVAKSPVEGKGIERPEEAYMFELISTRMYDEDIMIKYKKL